MSNSHHPRIPIPSRSSRSPRRPSGRNPHHQDTTPHQALHSSPRSLGLPSILSGPMSPALRIRRDLPPLNMVTAPPSAPSPPVPSSATLPQHQELQVRASSSSSSPTFAIVQQPSSSSAEVLLPISPHLFNPSCSSVQVPSTTLAVPPAAEPTTTVTTLPVAPLAGRFQPPSRIVSWLQDDDSLQGPMSAPPTLTNYPLPRSMGIGV